MGIVAVAMAGLMAAASVRPALPIGNPGAWVTTDDFRSPDMRAAMAAVAVRLSVDASGRVENCAIAFATSDGPANTRLCALITQRGRFIPAADAEGRAQPDSRLLVYTIMPPGNPQRMAANSAILQPFFTLSVPVQGRAAPVPPAVSLGVVIDLGGRIGACAAIDAAHAALAAGLCDRARRSITLPPRLPDEASDGVARRIVTIRLTP